MEMVIGGGVLLLLIVVLGVLLVRARRRAADCDADLGSCNSSLASCRAETSRLKARVSDLERQNQEIKDDARAQRNIETVNRVVQAAGDGCSNVLLLFVVGTAMLGYAGYILFA